VKKSATSMFVWGIYAVLSGITFLLVPNLPLTVLGLGESQEVYPRLLGVAITMLGYFYLRAARQESMTPLYAWSVHARLGLAGAIIVLVVTLVWRNLQCWVSQYQPPNWLVLSGQPLLFVLKALHCCETSVKPPDAVVTIIYRG
jgi:hypothetical protein